MYVNCYHPYTEVSLKTYTNALWPLNKEDTFICESMCTPIQSTFLTLNLRKSSIELLGSRPFFLSEREYSGFKEPILSFQRKYLCWEGGGERSREPRKRIRNDYPYPFVFPTGSILF